MASRCNGTDWETFHGNGYDMPDPWWDTEAQADYATRCESLEWIRELEDRCARARLARPPEADRHVVVGCGHGTTHAYQFHGCRCDPCTDAALIARATQRALARERAA